MGRFESLQAISLSLIHPSCAKGLREKFVALLTASGNREGDQIWSLLRGFSGNPWTSFWAAGRYWGVKFSKIKYRSTDRPTPIQKLIYGAYDIMNLDAYYLLIINTYLCLSSITSMYVCILYLCIFYSIKLNKLKEISINISSVVEF